MWMLLLCLENSANEGELITNTSILTKNDAFFFQRQKLDNIYLRSESKTFAIAAKVNSLLKTSNQFWSTLNGYFQRHSIKANSEMLCSPVQT